MSVSAQLYYHRNFQKTYYPEISVQSPGSNRAERPAYCDFLNAIDCVFIANTILGSLAKGSWLAAKLCYQMPVYLCNNFTLKIKSSLSAARLRDRLHHPQCKEPSYGIANPRSAVRQRELSVACYQYKTAVYLTTNFFTSITAGTKSMPAVFVFPVLQRIIFNRKKPWHNTTAIKNCLISHNHQRHFPYRYL